MVPSPSASLVEALERQCIELPDDQVRLLDGYCTALWQWNARLNLTRHTDYDTFVARDLVDSRRLADLLESGEEVLDVGCGGGVPGVVLTILRPDLDMVLCESTGKKARAVEEIVQTLGLEVPVQGCRAESLLEDFRFDTLVARAVGPLWKVCTWFAPHWASIGRILLIKGPRWVEERGEARHRGLLRGLELRRVDAYPMAGTQSESVILQLWAKRG